MVLMLKNGRALGNGTVTTRTSGKNSMMRCRPRSSRWRIGARQAGPYTAKSGSSLSSTMGRATSTSRNAPASFAAAVALGKAMSAASAKTGWPNRCRALARPASGEAPGKASGRSSTPCRSPVSSSCPTPTDTATVGNVACRNSQPRRRSVLPSSVSRRLSTPMRVLLPPARSTPTCTGSACLDRTVTRWSLPHAERCRSRA